MMSALAKRSTTSQSLPQISHLRRSFSPHQARRLKRFIITKFCRDELSAAAVQRAFQLFAELKNA
jgi:hypothetical protein